MLSFMSSQELTSNEWIIDMGTTDRVHANDGILESLSHNNDSHLVLVGNGSQSM